MKQDFLKSLYLHGDEALKEHERMSALFAKDRFKFEIERKEQINRLISSFPEKTIREELIETQKRVETILKNSGSSHNRFVLMQMLFWESVNEKFKPMLNGFS